MIGLGKSLFNRSAKKKTVVFDRFAVTHTLSNGAAAVGAAGGANAAVSKSETLCAKKVMNCDVTGNVLRQGVGAEFFLSRAKKTLTGIKSSLVKKILRVNLKVENSTDVFERFLVVCNDGYVRLYDEASRDFSVGYQLGANACGVLLRAENGEERYLISGENGARFFKTDEAFYPTGIKNTTQALCVCKNRLFIGQIGGRLLYSNPLIPWDFSESIHDGGYIQLPVVLGEPIYLTAVEEYVYVFYNHAILRLNVRGSGKDFRLEEVFYNGAKILMESICPIAGGVIFLAADGLWKLNGLKTEHFCKELIFNAYTKGNVCNAAICEGKYFLRYQRNDGLSRSVAVDLEEGTWYDCYNLVGLSKEANLPLFVKEEIVYQLGATTLPSGEKSLFESVDLER